MHTTTNTITDNIISEIEGSQEWMDKMPRQFELEQKMRGMGIDRHWSHVSKAADRAAETDSKAVRRLLNASIMDIAAGIDRFNEEASQGRAGRKHSATKYLSKMESEVIALITARVVLDSISQGIKLVSASRRISSMLSDELSSRKFKEMAPTAYHWLTRRERGQSSYQKTKGVMRHNAEARDIEWEDWPVRDQVIVGTKLIEIMSATTGLVQRVTRSVGVKRQEMFVEATPETLEWLQSENARCEALAPVYMPTIIPPKPWTTPTSGGYWSKRVRQLPLVKTYSRAYLDELSENDMPDVYDAVNAMQHTAWCINADVLGVVRDLWDAGSTLSTIPSAEEIPLPTRPAFLDEPGYSKEEWTPDELKAFKTWKRSATDTYAMNASRKSMRLQFAKTLMVGEMFETEEELYFPHQLDFRGRCYAMPLFLNPQGADLAKGLLTFANAVPIKDQQDADWLAIHGANAFGYDKDSLAGRVHWVIDNESEIIKAAANPYHNRLWCDADKPWQFLAFCFEWAAFKSEGYGFLSALPVAMDGSCNGLQNFSAMLRDHIGGAAVNLTPSDKPADIYQAVADRVKESVMQDAQSEDDETSNMACGWLKHGITRKVCKRPVMTLAYGAKAFGFKTQVFEDTVQPYKFAAGEDFPWDSSGWDAASYMGNLIWQCVGEVVVAARDAMVWLQSSARKASKEGLPVRWETPDKLMVLQAYPKMLSKRIDMSFGGKRHLITVSTEETKKLDKNRQANGIAPNWVHSMDAAHMRETVRRCWGKGVRSFSLIHDSYGTHAGNAWALAEELREAFVAMYAEDVMEKFADDLDSQLPDKVELDPLPQKGELDLSLVLKSDYFFA